MITVVPWSARLLTPSVFAGVPGPDTPLGFLRRLSLARDLLLAFALMP